MPRPNAGPHLCTIQRKGWTRAMFYIRWSENGRTREQATPFDSTRAGEAQEYLANWLHDRQRDIRRSSGRPGDPDQVTVVEVLGDYLTERGPEMESATLPWSLAPLLHFFRDDTLAGLTTGRVKEYWEWRRQTAVRTKRIGEEVSYITEPGHTADGTLIRELAGTLRPAIQHAIEQKRLAEGSYYIPVPPAPAGREYWITRPEAARLLREARRNPRSRLHLPLYILIAIYTGQRRGAILDLTWKQVDLVGGRIDFNPPGRIQTKKRRPKIPVPRSLLAALRRAHKRASSEYVIAYRGQQVLDVKTGFNSAAERAGIPDCSSHTLRHTAGTWQAQRGVPLWQIAGYLGHSVARTTELYAHHHPDHLADAKAAMEYRQKPISA